MASLRAQRAVLDDDSDEESPQPATAMAKRTRLDSTDEDSPAAPSGPRQHHASARASQSAGHRLDDLRPTTPPAGTSRTRPDQASDPIPNGLADAVHGHTTGGSNGPAPAQGSGSITRRHTVAGPRSSALTVPPTSTKAAAARSFDHSSSEEDELAAASGGPSQAASLVDNISWGGRGHREARASGSVPSPRPTRSSRPSNGSTAPSVAGATATASIAASQRSAASSRGTTGASAPGYAESHQRSQGSSRRQDRTSRLRRTASNSSLSSDASRLESLASSRRTQASKVTATVQRVVAQQQFMDSSSGDEGDGAQHQGALIPDPVPISAAAAGSRGKSAGIANSSRTPSRPAAGDVAASNDRHGSSRAAPSGPSAPRRHTDTTGTTLVSAPLAARGAVPGKATDPGAFSFRAEGQRSRDVDNAISPRMRQAAAAASAEVASAAASSLQPAALTAIPPAALQPGKRPTAASAPTTQIAQAGLSIASGSVGEGATGFTSMGGVPRHAQLSSSLRIASWLEQQPSLVSGVVTDDAASIYTTTTADGAAAFTDRRTTADITEHEHMSSGELELPGLRQEITAGGARPRTVRLTLSSDEDDGDVGRPQGDEAAALSRGSATTSPSPSPSPSQRVGAGQAQRGHTVTSPASGSRGRAAGPVMRRLDFASTAQAQAASPSAYSSPSLRPSESSPSTDDAPSSRVRSSSKSRAAPATAASTFPRPAIASPGPSPLRTMTASGAIRPHQDADHEAPRSAFEQNPAAAQAAATAARIASVGGLRHLVSPGAAGGGRMSFGDLRAVLSALARPAWASNAPAQGPAGSSVGSASIASADSVQSFTYSELLQMMRAMSSAGGGSLANLHLPPPSADGGSSVVSGRSGSSRATRKAGSAAPQKGVGGAPRAAEAPPPAAAQQPQSQARQPSPSPQKARAAGGSAQSGAGAGGGAGPGASAQGALQGGTAVPASSAGGSSMLMDEHPMAAPPARAWSVASESVASGASSTRGEQQQRQRDFAEMVRLWALLTGRHAASDAFDEPIEASSPAAAASVASPSSAMREKSPGRSISTGRGVSASSAAALAASAAAMATSAVIAAASSAYKPTPHAATVAGHQQPSMPPRSRSVSPSPARLGTAPAAPVRCQSPAPATAPRMVKSSAADVQPRYTSFSSLPPELQHLARLVSAAGALDGDASDDAPAHAPQPHGSMTRTPQRQASANDDMEAQQDGLPKLIRLLSTAGRAEEQQHKQQDAQPQQAQQPRQLQGASEQVAQQQSTAAEDTQTDLVRLIRLLSAAGQTDAPPSTGTAATQTDLVRLVRLLSAAGQTEEARTAVAATSVGGLAEPPVAASTSTSSLAPQAAAAATSTGGLMVHATTSACSTALSTAPIAVSTAGRSPGGRKNKGSSAAMAAGYLTRGASALIATSAVPAAAVPTPTSEEAGDYAASVCSLSSHNSTDTVETGLALSRMYETLRGMRLRDGGGQTDPPGTHSSSTQTAADLAASYCRSEGDQTDAPARASSAVQTEGLGAEKMSGAVQTYSADLRLFATRNDGGQTELPSVASACQQTDALPRALTLDGASQAGGAHCSTGGQTEAVGTSNAGQQCREAELVATADGDAQTELSHLQGGACRASQTEVRVAAAAVQTDVAPRAPPAPGAAAQTEAEKGPAPALSAAMQAELARVVRLVAASSSQGAERLLLQVEAARLARNLPPGFGCQPVENQPQPQLRAAARRSSMESSMPASSCSAAKTQAVLTRALRLPSGQLVELELLLPWIAEEAALEEAAGGAECNPGGWMQALRELNAALGGTPTSVSFTMPSIKDSARSSLLVPDASIDGRSAPVALAGNAALQRALQILASSELDPTVLDLNLSASASSEVGYAELGAIGDVRPAAAEGSAQSAAATSSLALTAPARIQPDPLSNRKDASAASTQIAAAPERADGGSLAAESAAATSITAGPAIAPMPAAAAASSPPEPLPRAPSPPTTTQVGTAIALRNLPIASDGGLMQAPHQEAVTAGRVGSSGGMLAFLEAADPTTATALMELVQALQLMTLHSRRRRYASDGSSVASGTYYHHHHQPPSPLASLGGSSVAPTTLRGSFVTSVGPSVSQAGETSLAGAAAAAAQADAAAAATAGMPAVKAATIGGAAPAPAPRGADASQRHTHTGGLPPRPSPNRAALPDPTAEHLQRALRAVSGGGTARSSASSAGGTSEGTGAIAPAAAAAATAKPHIARALQLLSSGGSVSSDVHTTAVGEEDTELQVQEELVMALMALLISAPTDTVAAADASPAPPASDCAAPQVAHVQEIEPSQTATEAQEPIRAFSSLQGPETGARTETEVREATAAAIDPSPASSVVSADMQRVMEQAERASETVSTLAGLPPPTSAAAAALDGVPFEQAIGFIMDGLRDFDGGPAQLACQPHMMYGSASGGGAAEASLGGSAALALTAVAVDALAGRRSNGADGGIAEGGDTAAGEAGALEPPGALQLTEADRNSIQALVAAAVAAAEAAARGLAHQEGPSPHRQTAFEAAAPAAASEPVVAELQEQMAPSAEQLPPPSVALARSSSRSSSPARLTRPAATAATGRTRTQLVSAAPGGSDDSVWLRPAPGMLGGIAVAGHARKQTPQQTPPETPPTSATPSPLRLIEQLADMGADAFARLLPGAEEPAAATAGGSLRSTPVTTSGEAPARAQRQPQTFGGAMDLPGLHHTLQQQQQPHAAPFLPCGDLDDHLMPVHRAAAVETVMEESEGCDAEGTDWGVLSPVVVVAAPRLPTFATPSAPALRCAPARSEPATTAGSPQSPNAASRRARTVGGAPAEGLMSSYVSIDAAVGVADPAEPLAETEPPVETAAAVALQSPASQQQRRQQGSPESAVRSAPVTAAGALEPLARQPQTSGGCLPSSSVAVVQPVPEAMPEERPPALVSLPVPRSAPVSAGGHFELPTRQLHTAGGAPCNDADPQVPALTALDRFKAPTPYHASPYKLSPNNLPLQHLGSVAPAAAADAAPAAAALVAMPIAATAASAWSAPASSGDEEDPGFAHLRLARDVMTGRRVRSPPADAAASSQQPPHPSGQDGARRELFSTISSADGQHEAARGAPGARAVAAAPAPSPAEQLLTQAAQLLLQAMQRAAEGQPEQEAALHVLLPVLKGLAAPGPAEGLPQPQEAVPFRSAPATTGGSSTAVTLSGDPPEQRHSSPGTLPGAERQRQPVVPLSGSAGEGADLPDASRHQQDEEHLERPRTAPSALHMDAQGNVARPIPFRSDGGAFSFSHGGVGEPQPETPSAAAATQATATAGAQPPPAVATAADLEAFKDEVMSSVRSALLEIVDMIGATVVQHRAGPGATADSVAAAAAVGAGVPGSEAGTDDSDDSIADGSELRAPRRQGGSGATVSYAPSGVGAGEQQQQEIRITRSELEAFMFGKAVLSSTTADDLLGVRLRDLYTPQLPQEDDDELVGGYDAATPGPHSLHGIASSVHSVATTDAAQAESTVTSPLTAAARQGGRRAGGSMDGSEAASWMHEAGAHAFRSESGGIGVPRNSALRKPLGDGAELKSLLRRSLEHLRGHLQHQPNQGSASVPVWSRAGSYTPSPSGTPAAAPTSPVSAAARKPPMPPKRTSLHHDAAHRAGPLAQAAAAAGRAASDAASDPGQPSDLEATFAQGAGQQMAAAAAAAVADLEASARAADDVELDAHLSAGLQPEPTTGVLRWPDPAAPVVPKAAPTGAAPTGAAPEGVEAFGTFLAALAEPVVQVAGLFLAAPNALAGGRQYPPRSVVIEELAEGEDAAEGAKRPGEQQQPQQSHPSVRPSRGMPGHVGAAGGAELADDDDVAAVGPADSVLESPRARSEASIPRLRLRPPAMEQGAMASRSTSATPLPGAALRKSPTAAAAAPSSPTPAGKDQPDSPSMLQPTLSSRLKVASSPGSRGSPADEDRPLSSFAATEGGGHARIPSPLRRRTISPGRPTLAPVTSAEALSAGVAPALQTALTPVPAPAPVAATVLEPPVGLPVGNSLNELEAYLQAFKSRIGVDVGGPTEAVPRLPRQRPVSPVTAAAVRDTAVPSLPAGPDASDAEVLARANAAVGEAWSAMGSVPGSDDGAGSVMTGFNLHTIRASAASALAAAAAVELTFSPRQGPEQDAVRASGGGMTVTGTASNSRSASSTATPTNPLLREHLEHFQALLEKANSLVDRLMVGDDEAASEVGTEAPTATPTPVVEGAHGARPISAGSARRQLHPRLAHAAAAGSTTPLAPAAAVAAATAPASKRRANARDATALPGSPSFSGGSELSAATPAPLSERQPSLDPELAALFPATAARLSCPDAHVQQSPDAAQTLVSSAVSAVPQLAPGASRARSLSSTPLSRSPANSVGGISLATAATSSRTAAATPTQAPSGSAAAAAAAATPLALVAALLAEAHSRMEFRSLEEQRGADKILSAVLDEHFATVLGTPRGFLTPHHHEPAWLAAAAAAQAAPAVAPLAHASPQAVLAAVANLSAAFNQQAGGNVQISEGDGPVPVASPAKALGRGAGGVVDQPVMAGSPVTRGVPQVPMPKPAEASVAVVPTPVPPPQPPQHPRNELADLLSLIMQQRSDLLTSALDQVHKVAAAAGLAPAPAAATAAPGSAAPHPGPFAQPPMPQRMGAAAAAAAAAVPPGASLPAGGGGSPGRPDASAHLEEQLQVLAALSVPATSVGLQSLPQPLMPYQEYDSESNPTSYNVSLAGSARRTGSPLGGSSSFARLPSGRLESPVYTAGSSLRSSAYFPTDAAASPLARPAGVASAGGITTQPDVSASLGGASAASAPATVSAAAAAVAAAPAAVGLPHLTGDSGSLSAAPHSGAAASHPVAGGFASRIGSATEGHGLGRPTSQATEAPGFEHPTHGDLPHGAEEDNSESASLVSYTTGQAMYEQRDTDLAGFAAGMDRSGGGASVLGPNLTGGAASTGGSSIHEGALRYNPIYDPLERSNGGASTQHAMSAGGALGNSSGGSSSAAGHAAHSSGGGGRSVGLSNLHHETAYTPLALAAAAAVAAADAAATPIAGGGSALHARLLSAGGTSTAVLDPNPAYDLHEDSASRPASTAGAQPSRLEASLSGGASTGGAAAGQEHPRLQLDFEAGSETGLSAGSGRGSGPVTGAGAALPLTPVGMLGLGDGSEGSLPLYPQHIGSDGDSFPASSDGLPSLLVPSLTESQVAMLSAAPELSYSRPHSRNLLRVAAAALPSQQQQQQLAQPHQGPASRGSASGASAASGGGGVSHYYSAGGTSDAAGGPYYSAYTQSAAASRAPSQAGAGQAQARLPQRAVSAVALAAAAVSTDDEVTGSVDFEELSREAAVVVDVLETPALPSAHAHALSAGVGHGAAQPEPDPLNSTIRVRSARGSLGSGGSRDGSRGSSSASAPAVSLPLEALLPGAGFGARPVAEPAHDVVHAAAAAAAIASAGGSFEAPLGPLTSVTEDAEEEEGERQAPGAQAPAAAGGGRARGSLVAAAVRRFESGSLATGPSALELPTQLTVSDAAHAAGVTSPKPVFKPASRTPSGLPRAPPSPGPALQGGLSGMSPVASAGPASRAASTGPPSARSSRRGSAASLLDEDIYEGPQEAAKAEEDADEAVAEAPVVVEVPPSAVTVEPSVVSSDTAFFAAGSPGISMSFSEDALGPQAGAASSSGEAFYVASGTPAVSSGDGGEEADASANEATSALVTREWVPGAEDEGGASSFDADTSSELAPEAVQRPAQRSGRAPTVVAFGRSTSNSGAPTGRPASPAPLRAVRSSSPSASAAGSRPASPAPQRATSGAAALAMVRAAGRTQSPAPSRHKSSSLSGGSAARGGSQPESSTPRLRNSMPGATSSTSDVGDGSFRSSATARQRPPQASGAAGGASGAPSRNGSQPSSPARIPGARASSSSVPGGRVGAEAPSAARAGSASAGGVSAGAGVAQAQEPVPLHEAVRAYRTSRRPQM